MWQRNVMRLSTGLLLCLHFIAAWGYFRTGTAPNNWHREQAKLPSHGFIDTDAHHRMNAWLLSHHDVWRAMHKQDLFLKVGLLEGAQLMVEEGRESIFLRCDLGRLHVGSDIKTAHCSESILSKTTCQAQVYFERTPQSINWTQDGTSGSCQFRQGEGTAEKAEWLLRADVRPVFVSTINGQSPIEHVAVFCSVVIAGALVCGARYFGGLAILGWASVLSLWIPLISPERVAVAFRAPYWNHWGLGLFFLLLCVAIGVGHMVLKQRKGWRGGMLFWVGGLLLSAVSGNQSLFSLAGFGTVGLSVWFLFRAVAQRSSLSVSLGVLFLLVCTEWGARYSATGQSWLRDLGYAEATMAALSEDGQEQLRQIQREYEIFEAGQFQAYPVHAFPVAYPPKTTRRRIVAMGGSSTGGAYQMDELSTFYPARLEQVLNDEFEVINQGVGGWTSYHMRRYLEHHLDNLAPDILTFYISNNDAARRLPADIEQIYTRLDQRTVLPPRVSLLGPLNSVHRLVWLSKSVAAVPPEKLTHNIMDIASRIPPKNRRILLLPELNYPNQSRLEHHHQRLFDMASKLSGVEVWDSRAALPDNPSILFLDQVHLSEAGHQWLAEQIAQYLESLGWLES